MASVAFILVETNFEYDDSWYYPGTAKNHRIFLSRESAEEGQRFHTVKWFRDNFGQRTGGYRGCRITDYTTNDRRYGNDGGIFNLAGSSAVKAFNGVFDDSKYFRDDCSDEDIWKLVKYMDEEALPYKIEEIEIEHPLA